jgi:hypothetical protein
MLSPKGLTIGKAPLFYVKRNVFKISSMHPPYMNFLKKTKDFSITNKLLWFNNMPYLNSRKTTTCFTCKVKHCGICHNGTWGRLENNSRLDILIFE